MLTLNRRGWMVRWAYVGADWIPSQTTICKVFWGFVFRAAVLVVLSLLISSLIAWIWMYRLEALKFIGIAVGCMAAVLGVLIGGAWLDERQRKDGHILPQRVRDSVPYQGIVAIKQRLCPLVRIE